MYTQVRGWLNVGSIEDRETYDLAKERLRKAQEAFLDDKTIRSWVCQDTLVHLGGNGSIYLFFGTELKNYNDDAETWIKYLLTYFPSAEGRIDFQFENEQPPTVTYTWSGQEVEDYTTSKFWLIHDGNIVKEDRDKTWTNGYGNEFK